MPTAISTIFGLLHINCFLRVPLPKFAKIAFAQHLRTPPDFFDYP